MKRGKLFVIAGIFCALIAPLNAESEAEADLSELSKEITTEASASETQVSVEPQEQTVGMQILFSQVFTGAIFTVSIAFITVIAVIAVIIPIVLQSLPLSV